MNWKDDFHFNDGSGNIIIKRNIFDYKDNFEEVPTKNNSFVADLETYKGRGENPIPVITIISYGQLSYLTKGTKDRKETIANFVDKFEGKALDLRNSVPDELSEIEKETEIFKMFLDDMISMTKKKSNSKAKKITVYMFNNANYDNSYILKVLVRMGYQQSIDGKFHKEVINNEELNPYRLKIKEYQKYLEENKGEISEEVQQSIENEIEQIQETIDIKTEYSNKYLKEFILLSNDGVKKLSLKFAYKGYKFSFKDVCKFLNRRLEQLGDIIGLDKWVDIGKDFYTSDYLIHSKDRWQLFIDYAIRDVEILWAVIKKFSKLVSFDNERISTISSLALHKWKELEENNKMFFTIDYHKWEEGNLSYRGGFTFSNEKYLNKILKNVHSYDINSSYPASMMENIPFVEINEDEVEENIKENPVAKLYLIRFIKFTLKEDMVPIIPNQQQYVNNSYYKDYDRELSQEIAIKQNRATEWINFDLWVWEKELDWYKKFYNDLEFEILETKYFKTKKLFNRYINHFYINKSQSDVDKIICSILKHYIENRDREWVKNNQRKEFDKYFNSENNLLNKPIESYWSEFVEVINSYLNEIDNLNPEQEKKFKADLENQLLYLTINRETTKLYLNTLYGKFGQNPDLASHIYLNEKFEKNNVINLCVDKNNLKQQTFEIQTVKDHKCLDKYVYSVIRKDKTKSVANNVYIASYITMLSRSKLFEVIHRYGNDAILYGDTDSVKIWNKHLDKEYINNVALGKWKYEETYQEFAYIGAKKYMYITDKGKFNFTIAGANGLSEAYKGYEKDKKIQLKIMDDFINFKLKIFKRGTSTNKATGEKLINDKPTEIQLSKKDNDIQFYSIKKQYEKVLKEKPVKKKDIADMLD